MGTTCFQVSDFTTFDSGMKLRQVPQLLRIASFEVAAIQWNPDPAIWVPRMAAGTRITQGRILQYLYGSFFQLQCLLADAAQTCLGMVLGRCGAHRSRHCLSTLPRWHWAVGAKLYS